MVIYILLFILPSIGLYWCKDKHKIVCVNTINECSSMHQWSIEGSYISLSENDINLIIKCAKETELVIGLSNGMNVTIKFDTVSKMFKVGDFMQKTDNIRCNIVNCKLCSKGNINLCSECNDGHGLFSNNSSCLGCIINNCKNCDNNILQCSSCFDGSYISGNTCIKCDDKCKSGQCSTTLGCISCNDNYYINDKRCTRCDNKCLVCNGPLSTQCTSCTEGVAYIVGNECVECDSNCVTGKCNPFTGCQECISGYYPSLGKCNKCDSPCLTCYNSGNNNCGSCIDGLAHIIETTCIECKNCKQGFCGNETGCYECEDSYYQTGFDCEKCDTTCKTCGNTKINCTSCNEGTFLDNTRCVLCDENCENNTCDAVNGCQKCIFGYFPDEKRCSPCDTIPNCLTCSQTNKNQCTSCGDRFIVVNNFCECPSHLYQNTSSTCDDCYKYSTNCKLCRNIINFGIRCEECFPPFVTVNGNCIKCGINTTFIGNGCATNNNNCEIQNGQNECLKCQNEFYLQNKMCEPFEHKELCKTNSKNTCEDCENGITTTGNCEESICKYYHKDKTSTKCIQCNKHSNVNLNGICEENNKDYLYDNNVIFKCKEVQYLDNNNLCYECQDEQTNGVKCKMVNSKIHGIQCDNSFVINIKEDKCFVNDKCETIEGNDCVSCVSNRDSIIENNCKNCVVEKCSFCQNDKCIVCVEEYLLTTTNECKTKEYFSCQKSHLNKCLKCEISFMRVDEIIVKAEYCEVIGNNIKYAMKSISVKTPVAFECNEGFVLTNGSCKTTNQLKRDENASDGCNIKTTKGCISCFNGYYRSNITCHKCENGCTTCFNATHCLSCRPILEFLNKDNKCQSTEDFFLKCKKEMPNMVGCAICQEGYYRKQNDCDACHYSCAVCKDLNSCITCKPEFFLIPSESLVCQNYSSLVGCLEKTPFGCKKCDNGYYIDSNVPRCKTCMNNCSLCLNQYTCNECQNENVYINSTCVHFSQIEFCIEAKRDLCSMCVEGKKPSYDGLSCTNKVNLGLAIGLPVVFVIIIVTLIALSIVGIYLLFSHNKEEKKMLNVCVFKINRSNIMFYKVNDWLVVNKEKMLFIDESSANNEITVNKETRELLCVGNKSKNPMKIQFSVMKGCDYYTIRTEPALVNLKSGEACEFEIFIKPLCSCNIEEKIVCVGLDIKKGVETTENITINAKTQMTTRLDYHELKEEKKLGEGSFGIVYLGEFRGHKVAIKKLREGCDDEAKVHEFEKEVSMLDKFRCEYLVHFYGAVFIPNRICMVTEFAEYGSLNDLMKKKREQSPCMAVKVKFMLDMAKGISYLHNNGIVHRDIKPDNLLVFSLDLGATVNAKVTDFGSSRNINMLMTNMTFTKGIGTPVYMAPEVLKQKKYKKSADIFSFGITFYETLNWCEAYDKNLFKFPWKIAEFVISGKRLERKESMSENQFKLIQRCWNQQPEDRPKIDEIVEVIKTL
ncbi:protein serine/threonine kinase, putative [Entamoeba invadens IP1]|uniref:Protein serine/threonine kinase, putative n=1 Tax=Entamoeba invadens IP1 TaxID=370355 RepID=A0A0A1UFY6_ENTIV|nr:protein serine/threonine kinase, putative [Entamoeba invadens IP1]ELP92044.1 protein serine/threonine kinase, putative [Entamoeba invadens IP1]|eukprot:XP_004258815.1 protein serine/threonine kinase, putative [Entamoeba invadens IP1]